jgi:hypothetical protein
MNPIPNLENYFAGEDAGECDSQEIGEELGLKFRTLSGTIEDLGFGLFEMCDKESKQSLSNIKVNTINKYH